MQVWLLGEADIGILSHEHWPANNALSYNYINVKCENRRLFHKVIIDHPIRIDNTAHTHADNCSTVSTAYVYLEWGDLPLQTQAF